MNSKEHIDHAEETFSPVTELAQSLRVQQLFVEMRAVDQALEKLLQERKTLVRDENTFKMLCRGIRASIDTINDCLKVGLNIAIKMSSESGNLMRNDVVFNLAYLAKVNQDFLDGLTELERLGQNGKPEAEL